MRALSGVIALLASMAGAAELPDPDAPFMQTDMAEVQLGHLLFYDPILSGNRTVACATCHHPDHATTDGVSLGLGDGATGLGPSRQVDPQNPPEQRIPRNAQALFNLGALEYRRFFHDGRVEVLPDGLRSPLGRGMHQGARNALAAQSMLPVLSGDEMAGHYSENDVAQAVRQGLIDSPGGAWSLLAARVAAIPAYRDRFAALQGDREIRFADIANALAAFIAFEWRAVDSPFDRFLRNDAALPALAAEGLTLFYGEAGCATCHSGLFQTDHSFHAIAMPQLGPGKAARFENHTRDVGRLRVTGDAADSYAFRTPSLRNVAQTGPYGHAGAFATLESVIRHHLDPVASLQGYDGAQAQLPELPGANDFKVARDGAELQAMIAANVLPPKALSAQDIRALVAFLEALTDEASLQGRLGVPDAVPSGLPVP